MTFIYLKERGTEIEGEIKKERELLLSPGSSFKDLQGQGLGQTESRGFPAISHMCSPSTWAIFYSATYIDKEVGWKWISQDSNWHSWDTGLAGGGLAC